MTPQDARKLQILADIKYRTRRQRLQKLVQKESAIRSDLAKLGQQAKEADRASDKTMQAIGADVIWQAWLGKSKTALNMKLALILAEKEQHLSQVRRAYGKVLVSGEIADAVSSHQRSASIKSDLDKVISVAVQRTSGSKVSR
ncbi:hypothetical protein So717_13190 [Roseobacter cerasinus]|uniref:Uncharacterized protein n=1 Tax=Roseobacter cerasinus TaxID=2602289 RepID=A0A640VTL1_9RHOB|nr:hypothetical protein [Roseobacter cerasinus]GFE49566.1 hypothetical protein So717_13190 [Roseobacter cerasinus]